MGTKSRPHAGSLAFYPRKRAKKETASFCSFPNVNVKEGEKSRPLNFLVYKAGMTHALGKDTHEKGVTAGHEVAVAATVLEAPPVKVFGIRAYGKAPKGFYGTCPIIDAFADNVDKALLKRMKNFKKKAQKKGEKAKKTEEKAPKSAADLEKAKEKTSSIRLLVHSQPGKTNIGKKTPDIVEVGLAGTVDQQLDYAKEKLGKEISISEAFEQAHFVDIRAVTKGKGMQGPVKRAGVKVQRPKAKKRRVVGSISPWNPSTVMWQVPRPGLMGYNNRTEYNKKILKIGTEKELKSVNKKEGFKNYGLVKNEFVVVAGSIAGPAKRAISLREPIRNIPMERHKIDSLDYIAGAGNGQSEEFLEALEEEAKAEHVVEQKEEKKEKKSVQDEIMAAAKGEEKREKPKQK